MISAHDATDTSLAVSPWVRWLRSRRAWTLILLTAAAGVAVDSATLPLRRVLRNAFGQWHDAPAPPIVAADPLLVVLLIVLIPFIETLVFQLAVLRGAARIPSLRHRPWVGIFLSALVFAVLHNYSVAHMAGAFAMGLLFAFMFHVTGPTWRAFWVVALSHGLHNGFVTVIGVLVARHANAA